MSDLAVKLEPGRYVLVCNLSENSQHYMAGMYISIYGELTRRQPHHLRWCGARRLPGPGRCGAAAVRKNVLAQAMRAGEFLFKDFRRLLAGWMLWAGLVL